MAFEIWDVANIPAFPNQEDNHQTTARPAIIIEDLQDQVVICPITKQLQQEQNYQYTIKVLKDSDEGRQMGLTFDSLIVLNRTATLKKIRLIYPPIGSCPQSIIDKIEDMLLDME